ncbi:MAG: hypothetical protein ACXACR_11865, partial [Candidatus Hodarchaeales archaeon]
SLLLDIASLANAERVTGVGTLMQLFHEMIETLAKECWLMSDQPLPYGKKGCKVNLIVPTTLSESFNELSDVFAGTLLRTLPTIPICLLISDRMKGLIMFPKNEPQNFSTGFYVKDYVGVTYLKTIWDFFWKQATPEKDLGTE